VIEGVAILAGLILLAFLLERWSLRRGYMRRERDRAREANNLRHITKARPWWREPPADGPEGDH
jgi:hypothetical protein